jgi:chorismate mutase
MKKQPKKTIIAGPCAAESREQIISCAKHFKKKGVKIMRASLWKPRTLPGFEGMGKEAIPWLAEVTKMGLTVATEVLLPEHVSLVLEIIGKLGDPEKVLFWLGSRNQNHVLQREIALRIKKEAPKQVKLLIKNQPWREERHWLGIIDHVLSSGLEKERIILNHRGFSPKGENPFGLRNLPDFEMAMKVKQTTGLPMLIDPSHIGGTVDNVFLITEKANDYDFDGVMVEVHPTPKVAKSDAKQQLDLETFDKLLNLIES